MAIDPYSNCPCGSGKKIKFCCRDLAPEIEKIERLLEADQRHACLEHIEQLEKKFPQRSYLEMRKASLLRQLGRADEADALLKELVHRDASNPVAWAEAVFLVLDREDQEFRVAVELLQRAIEAAGDKVPPVVLEAIALVAQYSHALGFPLVCLKHMHLYLQHDEENRDAFVALLRFQQSPKVSPLIKDSAWPPSLEASQHGDDKLSDEDKQAYESACEDANAGRIRSAERALTELAEKNPQSATIWHCLGLARGWLGDNPAAVDALRQCSALEIPFDDAVEIEALAQILDEEDVETLDVVEVVFPTEDLEQARTQLSASKQVHELPGDYTTEGDQPPPRALALLLDRPIPENADAVTFTDAPNIVARLAYFGKETDQPARITLVVQSDRLDQAREQLKSISGDVLQDEQSPDTEDGQPKVVGQVSLYAAPFSERKFVPQETSADRRYEIIQDERRQKLLEVWPEGKLPPLGGKTPREAAKAETADRVRLGGVILNMEIASQRETVSANAFSELRSQLEMPSPVIPEGAELHQIPLVRMTAVDPAKLSDDELLSAFMRAGTNRFPPAIVKLGQEILDRPSLTAGDDAISSEEVCGQIAELYEDSRLALEWNQRAREFSLAANASCAGNDLFELYVRLNRGEAEDTVRLLQHLMDQHGNEPGVRNAVAKVLQETGLMNPDGTMARGKEPAIVTADGETEPGKIWTPDAEAAPTGGGESKIWVPE